MCVLPFHQRRENYHWSFSRSLYTANDGQGSYTHEVHEPYLQGRGASSCMPQKRNPVVCESLLEGARLITADVCTLLTAQVHDHDRGFGFAHIERKVVATSTALIAGCSELFTDVLRGIEINEDGRLTFNEVALRQVFLLTC